MAKMNYQKFRNSRCIDTVKEHSSIFVGNFLEKWLKAKKDLLEILSSLNYKDQSTAQELIMYDSRFKNII